MRALIFVLFATTAIPVAAQTFTTLYSFDGTDGAAPAAPLIQARNGKLYGTTEGGGAYSAGTIFEITPSGTLSTVYSFCSQDDCADGSFPYAGLVQGTDGNFYGTTTQGGTGELTPCDAGCGTVFRITPGGELTTLYSFCPKSGCADGADPAVGLVQGTDGNFYGTTNAGGVSNNGTVFKITPGGELTTLHSFCSQNGCTDGSFVEAALIQATDGSLYGTTILGGSNNEGTVFKITPGGALTTLWNFCSQSLCTDGQEPRGALLQATDGNFYGTTFGGGADCVLGSSGGSCGIVFKITPSGELTTLYIFCKVSPCDDGAQPFAGLVQGTDGNLYGTTSAGGGTLACINGSAGCGTIFKITPGGTLTTLHRFCNQSGCTDGLDAYSGLALDTNGEFYGTAEGGGTNEVGTVFRLDVGLNPWVETQPTSGKVGEFIEILGTNLEGTTSVSFNGTGATFTVVSNSLITTTVPVGATSGLVVVDTPLRALKSNKKFRVEP